MFELARFGRSMRCGAGLFTLVVWLAGCAGQTRVGASEVASPGDARSPSPNDQPNPTAVRLFEQGLSALGRIDGAADPAACENAAKLFLSAADSKGGASFVATSHYNAGVARQRCGDHDGAKRHFEQALAADEKFFRARVELALYVAVEKGDAGLPSAMAELRRAAVVDARFSDPKALVALGMLHSKRGRQTPNEEGLTDADQAKRFAQTALAIDDKFMPAYNLLALVYLDKARQKKPKVDTQMLDLAALVCSQAVRKNGGYAPIHNTGGLIAVELNDYNAAVRYFDAARKLDPDFFEAQMNFAAVNLAFRGFSQAEQAYRSVLAQRPRDYDAHLGLAYALRGQIDDTNFERLLSAVGSELGTAKNIAPERPETYYNEAILTQEFKAKLDPAPYKAWAEAKTLFQTFIQKAGTAPAYAGAVSRSKERIQEIDEMSNFMAAGGFDRQTEAQRKADEAEAKNRAAEAELLAPEGESEAPPPPPAPPK